jgi:BirA family biotin operon repressor/biotin-[acetyl-CoA-carboxylase] ligase
LTRLSEEKIGQAQFRFPEVSSTNDVIRTLFNDGVIGHGAVAIAGFQTNGRGQEQAEWESEKDQNLLCSYFLEPVFLSPDKQIFLNMAICQAVTDALKVFNMPVQIKWPNDIYSGNKKMGGILIENGLNNDHIRYCIAGIGLNINQTVFSHSSATSMKLISNKDYQLLDILGAISLALQNRLEQLRESKFSQLSKDYHDQLFRSGMISAFIRNGESFQGKVVGVDDSGRLMLEVDGKMVFFHNKEIQWKI